MFGSWKARIGRRYLLWRSQRAYTRRWAGGPLRVEPGVLDPVATKVGAWLAEHARRRVRPGERWVDMGCGTGAVGIAMAEAGAVVTAVDVDPACVQNAAHNARLRGVTLTVLAADHFAFHDPAAPPFDGVVYNVPFWPGEPAREGRGETGFDRAFFAGDDFGLIRRFAAEARAHARVVWVALSEAGARHGEAVAALGPARRVVRERHRGEHLVVYELLSAGTAVSGDASSPGGPVR